MRIQQIARVVAVVIPVAAIGPAGTGAIITGATVTNPRQQQQYVTEIVRDITEMSALSPAMRPAAVVLPVDRHPGRFIVSFGTPGVANVALDLTSEHWATSEYALMAQALFSRTEVPEHAGLSVHAVLSDLNPRAMVTANTAVSAALRADIGDAAAHESAALLLAAFALRESSGRAFDGGWAISRLTAHLAIARALRGGAVPGVDGELAEIARLALTELDSEALTRLEIRALNKGAEAIWVSTLRRHVMGDGAGSGQPESSRSLTRHDDYRSVFEQMHGRPMQNSRQALSARAGRAVGPRGIDVLPWGAWAQAANRHPLPAGQHDASTRR